MEISKEKQVITIPKSQYDEMEKIVNEKKDINVSFYVYEDRHYYSHKIYSQHSVFSINNKEIFLDDIRDTAKLIETTIEYIENKKNATINILISDLREIKSKWWYKLFTFYK